MGGGLQLHSWSELRLLVICLNGNEAMKLSVESRGSHDSEAAAEAAYALH